VRHIRLASISDGVLVAFIGAHAANTCTGFWGIGHTVTIGANDTFSSDVRPIVERFRSIGAHRLRRRVQRRRD